ncbi:MAG: glycosyltransferase family 4 protein [Acidimicrobiales bacterium]
MASPWHCETLTSSQAELGHEVTVLGPQPWFGPGLDQRIRQLDWTRLRPLDSRLALDMGLLRRVVKRGTETGDAYDIVHLHSSRAGLVGRLADLRAPVVFQPHGWSFHPLQGRWRQAAMSLERRLASRSRGVLYCSEAERRVGLDAGIDPEHQLVALNAPSVPRLALPVPESHRIAARRALELPEEAPVYGFVGRITDAKAPDRLWRAWAAVRRRNAGAQLLVMGEGLVPALPGLRHLGLVDDVGAHLDACDALVLLSRWEGMPLAILDAMARGVPVVASREAIDPEDLGEAGTVVDGDSPAAVADALLARRVGTAQWWQEALAGLDLAADRYDPGRLAGRVCDFYRQVVPV